MAGVDVPAVQDKGQLPESLPSLFIPNVPLTWDTLQVLAPFSLSMALVGLLESLMTAKLVDDITDTRSNKTRESWGQGVANIVTGFLGGMGGCAVIGQTLINVKGAGARSRVSTFLAGVFLLVLVVVLGDVVGLIPMAALVAVMIFVSAITFDWHSISPRTLRRLPRSETAVMLITVGVVVATHNLAIGVGAGVLAAMAMFARRVAHFVTVERTVVELNGENVATYTVDGELFFASSNDLYMQFEYALDAEPDISRVVVDLHASHLWDASTIAVLDAVTEKYRRHGREVELIGLNSASIQMRERLAGKLNAGS
jgi:SulP family sulfate permease